MSTQTNKAKINCLYDKLVLVSDLVRHPKNRNRHPGDQIIRLADILKYQGWRYPVKVSKRSGFVTSGHGRIEAAKRNGWEKVPVNYQDYDSEEQEYADVQADNTIASWAELDLSGVNTDLADLGPDFNLDMLGIRGFELDLSEKLVREVNKGDENSSWIGMPEFELPDKEVRLSIIFSTELEREVFIKKNALPITDKKNNQWTSRP